LPPPFNRKLKIENRKSEWPRVLVIGLGNLLAGDEGLGPHAVRRLLERGLPEGVEAVDAATDLLAVVSDIERAGRVILIDAIRAGGTPGAVYRWTLDELFALAAQGGPGLSGHELTLIDSLRLAQATGTRLPPIVVCGIEPAEIAFATELTPVVAAALESLLDAIMAEVAGHQC
jgi:hydrogenase maturation protease